MEEDGEMRRFLEQFIPSFLSDFVINIKNNVTSNSFVPRGCLTKAFFQNLKDVLTVKKYLILRKWENFFAISCFKSLSSHEMYFRYVFFACEYVVEFSSGVFDGIISVFALVINYVIETLIITGVNFCGLIVDIIMVFYESALKDDFYRLGGFECFAEYLRHEYLKWECYFNDSNELSTRRAASFVTKAYCKLVKELGNISYQPEFITYDDVIKSSKCRSLANQLLSSTKIRFPTLPSPADLEIKFRAARQQNAELFREITRINALASTREISEANLRRENSEADPRRVNTVTDLRVENSEADLRVEKTKASGIPEALELAQQESSGLSSNFKISDIFGNKVDISRYSNTIQAVIRYNNLKFSDPVGTNSGMQNEINKLLEPFKDMIKSLIEILDENSDDCEF